MAIRRNKYGVWQCDFTAPNGKRIRYSLETKDKKQAKELHDKLKNESWRVKSMGDFPSKTFNEACLRWVQEKNEKKSLDDDKTKITYFLEFFSGVNLSDITTDKIQYIVMSLRNRKHRQRWEAKSDACTRKGKPVPDYKEKQVSPQTRHSYLSWMRALLNQCRRWKWLDVAPVIETKQPKNGRVRWETPENIYAVFSYLPEYFKDLALFDLSTGLRRSNASYLEWSQVDLTRKVAWIHPDQTKTGEAIGVPLNETAIYIILKQKGKHKKFVFTRPTKNGNVPLRIDSNGAWNTALKKAGIENFRFHDLRHTWASWLTQSGVPELALQKLGGWENAEMVKRYAHLSPSHLANHANKIDAFMSKFRQSTN